MLNHRGICKLIVSHARAIGNSRRSLAKELRMKFNERNERSRYFYSSVFLFGSQHSNSLCSLNQIFPFQLSPYFYYFSNKFLSFFMISNPIKIS